MRLMTPKRVFIEELLDAGIGADDDVAENLADLRRINRLLGCSRVVVDALSSLSRNSPRLSLLDVGTASADIPGDAAAWCDVNGVAANIVALDISERNLRVSRERFSIRPEVSLVRADALSLPFEDLSFDFVSASSFLHHFRDVDVVRLLTEFARVARRAVIVTDLVRHLVPYCFTRMAGPFFTSSFLTRHDGPVSVLRGFTPGEMRQMAALAGLTRCRIRRAFPYRLVMIANLA